MRIWMLLALLACAAGPSRARGADVVAVHDATAVRRFEVDSARVKAMLHTGLLSLTRTNDSRAAWQRFCSPHDVVGIKINTQSAPLHGTHRALVDAIRAGLQSAGVQATNIWVFDRDLPKMQARGFATATATQEVAIVGPDDYDLETFYDNRLAGRLIWGDRLFGQPGAELSTRSHLPKLLTKRLTKLINVPVLQDHEATGLAGCLYNLSLGLVDNTRRFEAFAGRSDGPIAEINALAAVRDKTVLHIMDGLVGGFAGGPSFKPHFGWHCGRLYLSTDPVALDTVALEQIEAQRRAANVPAIGARAHHIGLAARLSLGQSQRDQIRVLEPTGSDHAGKDDQK